MKNLINAKVDEISEELISSIIRLVKIKSVEGEPEEQAPFGLGPKKALEEALSLSEELGFQTKNIDNYAGYAQFGQGFDDADYIGIFGHLDVVPEGDGWKYQPYGGEIDGGKIYGRGVLDNKGPIISNLYALYVLKELGIKTDIPVRIVFGTNEETGFKDMDYFLKNEKPPVMGWTPDNKFPAIYGERGRAVVEVSGEENQLNDLFDFMNEYILSSNIYGNKLEIDIKDEEFGLLEMRNYNLRKEDKRVIFRMSLSYPAITNKEELREKIQKKAGDLDVSIVHNFDPVKFEKDSFLVEKLTEAYMENTDLDPSPLTTTGGTYAKIVPNIIPFGPSFPGQKGIGHNPDEWMIIEDIILMTKIYANAIYKLISERKEG